MNASILTSTLLKTAPAAVVVVCGGRRRQCAVGSGTTRFQTPPAQTERGFFDTRPVSRLKIKGLEHGKFGHNIRKNALYRRTVSYSFTGTPGITTVAGIPGGSILPIYDALSQSTQIRHVLARHEQGAGFIAQGMARTEGKPAVCMACSGPGATNLITAIADARLDSIPLVCITGQVPASMIGTDAFQEVDTYGISIPITKHNYLVRDIAELPQVMSDAFALPSPAARARCG
jgi:acetolactate synthase-1/2/3 large subunit